MGAVTVMQNLVEGIKWAVTRKGRKTVVEPEPEPEPEIEPALKKRWYRN